jgi:hypothetical protein
MAYKKFKNIRIIYWLLGKQFIDQMKKPSGETRRKHTCTDLLDNRKPNFLAENEGDNPQLH